MENAARRAYEAYARAKGWDVSVRTWEGLHPLDREAWLAVARAVLGRD